MNSIAECLYHLRNDNNKSKEELAVYLDITVRSYARYESGDRVPDLQTLIALSKYYSVPLDFFVVDNGSQKNIVKREEVFCYKDITDKGYNGKLAHGLIREVLNNLPYHQRVTVPGSENIKFVTKDSVRQLLMEMLADLG
ncbi:XRE family transcriptional regulator [Streptococcus minor]|uniref:XRE family transcriptional regulator n=1 Tax=Streptococcus minor TaxID=229549 RepID=A0A3P1VCS1_9STRE|nr:helix-turn-helix transcriptional regulator [Streptococcus minor]RRD31487.1 XRE family transcriptional regulator [Streptococcus minor]